MRDHIMIILMPLKGLESLDEVEFEKPSFDLC